MVDELKETPTTGNRQIARLLGLDHKTVASVRDRLASGGKFPTSATKMGANDEILQIR